MRTVTYGAAVSLDGYIAGASGAMDWLRWTPEAGALMEETWRAFDTVVMGRRTYEAAVEGGMPAYPGVRNIVVSRTLERAPHAAVEVAPDGADLVRRLRQEEGRGICVMGGGVLAASLLDAGLIDEIGINLHPVLLGSGTPLLPPFGRFAELELRECRPLSRGCVYLVYRVTRADPADGRDATGARRW